MRQHLAMEFDLMRAELVRVCGMEDVGSSRLEGRLLSDCGERLIYIWAFYKTDHPQGFSVRVGQQNREDLSGVLNVLREAWDRLWRAAVNAQTTYGLVRLLEKQIDEIGARRRGGTPLPSDIINAIANIDLLERVGHLKSGEHSGIVLLYDGGEGSPSC